MNKSDELVEKCVVRLQKTVDALALADVDRTLLLTALVEVIVQTAYEDRPNAAADLEYAADLLTTALEGARLDKELDQSRRALSDLRRSRRRRSNKKRKSS